MYETSLENGVWSLTREVDDYTSDFSQRFTGRVSADGSTITGAWETSFDGATWEHDFDLVYSTVPVSRG
jgi:hypothetical protein